MSEGLSKKKKCILRECKKYVKMDENLRNNNINEFVCCMEIPNGYSIRNSNYNCMVID